MKDKLLIIGAGGHGKVVADVAMKMGMWKEIAFLDDEKTNQKILGLDVIGSIDDYIKYKDNWCFFIAIGDNNLRKSINNQMKDVTLETLIHPNAIVAYNVKIGEGTVLMAGSIINTDSIIGKCCIVNTGATIDHDNYIKEYVHVSPGVNIGGFVTVGTGTWLGINSCVINNIQIGKWIVIGAGSTVIRDINEVGVYIGVPAKKR